MAVKTPSDIGGADEGSRPDAAHAADALLLLRLALSDGPADERAVAVLRRVAHRAFGIDALSAEALMPAVEDFGAGNAGPAAAVLRERPKEERLRLAETLLTIARHDEALKNHVQRLRGRLTALLDLEQGALS